MHSPLTPMLAYADAAAAIDWYTTGFGAEEIYRLTDPEGRIGHAEIQIEDAVLMIADHYPQYNSIPEVLGGTTVILNLYVKDVDAFYSRAVEAGAAAILQVKDQFYGDRSGRLRDPFGHVWIISTHKADVSPEDMQEEYGATI